MTYNFTFICEIFKLGQRGIYSPLTIDCYKGFRYNLNSILFESFIDYLNCGKIYIPSTRNEINFFISVYSDIIEKIIPIFEEYPLIGVKKEYYRDFVKVAELIKSKEHLTEEGIKKIEEIKNNMNSNRITE